MVFCFLLARFQTAFAQDAASTPFHQPLPSDPEPTTTPPPAQAKPERKAIPEPTPAPLVSVAPTAAPTAKPQRTAAAEETRPPTPASTPRRPAAAPRPAPVAREAAAPPVDADSVAGTIKRLENEWEASFMNHDISVIEKLVADDFVGVSSSGKIGDKLTMIYETRRDKSVYKSAAARKIYVHTFGAHVAVAMGLTRETGTTADGRPFDRSYRFTDTWVERSGKWQCVAAHATAVPKR